MAPATYREKVSNIKSIKQAGISISPGLPDITVGPWQMENTTDTLDSGVVMLQKELILVQVVLVLVLEMSQYSQGLLIPSFPGNDSSVGNSTRWILIVSDHITDTT